MSVRRFTLASAVSLLLCLGVGVLWVRSYRVMDHLYYTDSHDRSVGVLLRHGFIQADLIANGGGQGWDFGSESEAATTSIGAANSDLSPMDVAQVTGVNFRFRL